MSSLVLSKDGNEHDGYESIVTKLLNSLFFPWIFLILILTYSNWKRLIVVIMVLHWLLRGIGDIFENILWVDKHDDEHWPYGNKLWLKSYGVASIFWYLGEIVGDWYLLLRTKAIIRKRSELKWVFLTCGLYNIVKCVQIYTFLSYVPFYNNTYDETTYILDMAENKFLKWTNVAFQQLCSLAYDISVIIALKRNVFNNKENLNIDSNGYSFLKKFKQISVYRIYLSILVTICGIPLIFMYSLIVVYYRNSSISLNDKERLETVRIFIDDSVIDPIRVLILNFNYTFMYIDQILLRFYVEQNNSSKKSSSAHSNSTQKSSYNFNMVYHDHKNYEEIEKSTKPLINSKPMYYNIVFNNNITNDVNYSNNINNNSKEINYYNYKK